MPGMPVLFPEDAYCREQITYQLKAGLFSSQVLELTIEDGKRISVRDVSYSNSNFIIILAKKIVNWFSSIDHSLIQQSFDDLTRAEHDITAYKAMLKLNHKLFKTGACVKHFLENTSSGKLCSSYRLQTPQPNSPTDVIINTVVANTESQHVQDQLHIKNYKILLERLNHNPNRKEIKRLLKTIMFYRVENLTYLQYSINRMFNLINFFDKGHYLEVENNGSSYYFYLKSSNYDRVELRRVPMMIRSFSVV